MDKLERLRSRFDLAQGPERCALAIELGQLHNQRAEYTASLDYYKQALLVAEDLNDTGYIIKITYWLAVNYERLSMYSLAGHHALQCHNLADKNNHNLYVARVSNLLGVVNYKQGRYDAALEYYMQALRLSTTLDEKQTSRTCNNIGLLYTELGDYDAAITYLEKACLLKEAEDDASGLVNSLNNLGNIYMNREEYSNALGYYQRSFNLLQGTENRRLVSHTLNNMGKAGELLGQMDQALDYYLQSLRIKYEVNDRPGLVNTLHNIGNLYKDKKDYPRALTYAEQALKAADEVAVQNLQRMCHQLMARIGRESGNWEMAAEHFRLTLEIREELSRKEINTRVAELTARQEFEQTEILNEIKRHQLRQEQQTAQTISAYRDEILALEKKNAIMNMALTANHELAQPLTVLQSNLDLLGMQLDLDDNNLSHPFDLCQNALEKCRHILHQLKEIDPERVQDYHGLGKRFLLGEQEEKT